MHMTTEKYLSCRDSGHQSRRKIDIIPQRAEDLACPTAVSAHAHESLGDAHLQLQRRSLHQLQRGLHCAACIIFMCTQHPEVDIRITALVSDGNLQKCAMI